MAPPLLAIIDDDPTFLGFMQDVLLDAGYRVALWMRAAGATAMVLREQPVLVILDLGMEHRRAGMDVLGEMRAEPRTTALPVLVCSADCTFLREQAGALGAMGCATLEKPFVIDELVDAVAGALESTGRLPAA
jgi:DNA-binding response OmpR family regulator